MRVKSVALVAIVGMALAVAAVMRTANRADAAGGDCYSDSKGPSEPTICN
jgi:hypothetical protein